MGAFDDEAAKRIAAKNAGYLNPPEPHQAQRPKVGNSYIDRGMQCDAVPDAANGCWLLPEQRARVVDLFHGRVLSAQQAYLQACEQLRVGELIAKEPSPGLLFEAILEVVGIVVLGGLGRAVKNVVAFGERVVAEAKLAEQDPDPLMQRLAKVNTRNVEQVNKSIISMTKKHASKTPPSDGENKVSVKFLETLANEAGPMYEDIRENQPALVSGDADLLLLLDSFSASNHTIDIYKEQIQAKLDRWQATQLSDIGVRTDTKLISCDVTIHNPFPTHITGYDVGPRDTKLFVVNTFGQKRLGVFRRQFKLESNYQHVAAPWAIPPITPTRPDLPRSPMTNMTEDDYAFVEFVPEEFESIALKAHFVAWGHDPKEKTLVPWSKP